MQKYPHITWAEEIKKIYNYNDFDKGYITALKDFKTQLDLLKSCQSEIDLTFEEDWITNCLYSINTKYYIVAK